LLLSLDSLKELGSITIVINAKRLLPFHHDDTSIAEAPVATRGIGTPAILNRDLERICEEHVKALFEHREVTLVRWLGPTHLGIDWSLAHGQARSLIDYEEEPLQLADLPDPRVLGFRAHKTVDSVYDCVILSRAHSVVRWLTRAEQACAKGRDGLKKEQFAQLISLLLTPVRHQGYELGKLVEYLSGWRRLPGLSPDLYPPDLELDRDMFILRLGGNA